MMKQLTLLSLAIFFFTNCVPAQTANTNYNVDHNLQQTVDKRTTLTKDLALGQMEVKMFENDSLIIDTYGKDKKVEFFTMTTMQNDTIHITGFAGMFIGFGFYLDLFKDKYTLTHLVKSDGEFYKLSKSDPAHAQQIHIGYELGKLRGETNSILKLKSIIPPQQYKSIKDSLIYTCGVVGIKASTIEMSNQNKKMINEELEKISTELGK